THRRDSDESADRDAIGGSAGPPGRVRGSPARSLRLSGATRRRASGRRLAGSASQLSLIHNGGVDVNGRRGTGRIADAVQVDLIPVWLVVRGVLPHPVMPRSPIGIARVVVGPGAILH